jgi:hypothetical protein
MPHKWYHTKDDVETSPFQAGLGKLFETGISAWAADAMDKTPSAGEVSAQSLSDTLAAVPQLGKLSRTEADLNAKAFLDRRLLYDQQFADQDLRMADEYSQLYQLLNSINEHRGRYMTAASEVTTAKGPGGELSREIQDQLKEADPEFYDARAQMGAGYGDLLRSYAAPGTVNYDEEGRPIDTGRFTGALSEGERAEIERALARQGVQTGALTGPRSMSNVVAGAMKFGQGVQGRRDAFSRALASATGFLPASRSGFDPLKTMFGRPSTTFPTQFSQPQATGQGTQGSDVFRTTAGVGQTVAGLNAGQDWIGDIGSFKNLMGWGPQNDPWQRKE